MLVWKQVTSNKIFRPVSTISASINRTITSPSNTQPHTGLSSIPKSQLVSSHPRIQVNTAHRPRTFTTTTSLMMATATTITLSPTSTPGSTHVSSLTKPSASKASTLLQQNHDKNHIFFNDDGFHNHIAHQLLAVYALGASPEQLQRGFDQNQSYQKPLKAVNESVLRGLEEGEDEVDVSEVAKTESSGKVEGKWKEYLGQGKYFREFEEYFRQQIVKKGWEVVVKEALFAGTEKSEDLLLRMFGGFYHPIIHLGYGIEFAQPPIIAEALAQGAVHANWMGKLLTPLSPAKFTPPISTAPASLPELLRQCRDDTTLMHSAHESDGNKVRDGVIARAGQQMIDIAKKWWVPRSDHDSPTEQDLNKATAEMVNACMFFTLCAQRAEKRRKVDFYYMHCTNLSVFYRAFLQDGEGRFLDVQERARLLEMKVWSDLALYASRGCPELSLKWIEEYVGKKATAENKIGDTWEGIIKRVNALDGDDGHAPKLIRALLGAKEVCVPLESEITEGRMMILGEEMWLRAANMAIDGMEELGKDEPKWIRNAGWDSAWVNVPAFEGVKTVNGTGSESRL